MTRGGQDTGLEYLVNHLPEWNESGELLSLGLMDEFFLLNQSIYLDILGHHLKRKNEMKAIEAKVLKLRDNYRHISVDNIIGDSKERTLRSSRKPSASN